jgi:hypothetical protein
MDTTQAIRYKLMQTSILAPFRSVSFWGVVISLLGCSSDLPSRRVGLDNPVSVVTLQDDEINPLSYITSASFSPDGNLLLLSERHSHVAHLYDARSGRLLRTLQFETALTDSIVAHSPMYYSDSLEFVEYRRLSEALRGQLSHQVHNAFFLSDSTLMLTGYLKAFAQNPKTHQVVDKAVVTALVTMDTSGRAIRVVPTAYPSYDQFQNSDAVAYSPVDHRWYLNHEYWKAYKRGHYDSMMVVASFNDTGADKRTSFPLPKELWSLSVDYGPATPHFAIDSNDHFYASLACLPYIYDETGKIRFTLQLPVSNTAFLRESRVAFVNQEQMSSEHVWQKDSFIVLDIGINANRLDVLTAIDQATAESSRYYLLVQEYSLDGELLSQTRIGDKSPLGKPKFFGINNATGKPYMIAQKDDAFKLYQLSWK